MYIHCLCNNRANGVQIMNKADQRDPSLRTGLLGGGGGLRGLLGHSGGGLGSLMGGGGETAGQEDRSPRGSLPRDCACYFSHPRSRDATSFQSCGEAIVVVETTHHGHGEDGRRVLPWIWRCLDGSWKRLRDPLMRPDVMVVVHVLLEGAGDGGLNRRRRCGTYSTRPVVG